jgi:hypothetical protein
MRSISARSTPALVSLAARVPRLSLNVKYADGLADPHGCEERVNYMVVCHFDAMF